MARCFFTADAKHPGATWTRAADRRGLFATSRASRVAANRLYQQLGFQLRDSNVYRYEPQPRPR